MLELRLKKKWYDMIDAGIKKEEYRELKPYWWARVFTSPYHKMQDVKLLPEGGYNQKHYTVRFRLGYKKDAPEMIWKMSFNIVGRAKPEWSEDNMDKVIVLPLRKRLSNKALIRLKDFPKGEQITVTDCDEAIEELLDFNLLRMFHDEFGSHLITNY